MKSQICKILDIEFPLVAFSHCRDVVAAVSKAGGMGVLGAVGLSPEKLEIELNWIDENIDGKPYGVDVLVPNSYVGKGENLTTDDLRAMIPQEHREFRADILEQHDIDAVDLRGGDASEKIEQSSNQVLGAGLDGAKEVLEVAFSHPIKLVANALGVPPKWMLDMGKQK
jgi:Dioxygenases related to 2-nitropropane dioxygenase